MIIKNEIVYTEDKKFTAGGIVVHDDKIKSIYTTENVPDMPGEEVVDGQGAYAIPGLIDLHFNGCMGDDFCDNSKEAIENIALFSISNYFLRFSNEYKKIHGVDEFDNNWYEYVEFGTTIPFSILL